MGRFPLRKIFPKTPAIWPSPARTELGAGAPPEHKGKRTSHRPLLFLPLLFCGPFRGPEYFGILDLAFGPQATTHSPLSPVLRSFYSLILRASFEVLRNLVSSDWPLGHRLPHHSLSFSRPVFFLLLFFCGPFRGPVKFGISICPLGHRPHSALYLFLSLSLIVPVSYWCNVAKLHVLSLTLGHGPELNQKYP